jgi:MFS family permease
MLSSSRYLGQLLGPAIGGGMLLALGPAWGIFANALFYVPIIVWLFFVPYGKRKETDKPARARRGFGEIVETLRLIAHDRLILAMILVGGFTSLFIGSAYQAQMPEFAHDLVHESDHASTSYSILLAANAVGALLGGLALESRSMLAARAGTVYVLVMLWCVAISVFALTENYVLAVAALAVAGFLNLAYSAMTQTLVQTHAPTAIRGRVIGLYQMSSLGMRTFSGITVGVAGGLIGVHWSLAASAMALLAVTVVMLSLTSWISGKRA